MASWSWTFNDSHSPIGKAKFSRRQKKEKNKLALIGGPIPGPLELKYKTLPPRPTPDVSYFRSKSPSYLILSYLQESKFFTKEESRLHINTRSEWEKFWYPLCSAFFAEKDQSSSSSHLYILFLNETKHNCSLLAVFFPSSNVPSKAAYLIVLSLFLYFSRNLRS